MGFASDKELNTFKKPDNGQSIVRKASMNSSVSSLPPGGSEEHAGNGYDSNNNAADFVLFTSAMPKKQPRSCCSANYFSYANSNGH